MMAATLGLRAADVDVSKLPPASDKKDLTYAKDIKPIFEKSCFKCHGEEKQKGKLRLDSVAAVKKGGEDGEVQKRSHVAPIRRPDRFPSRAESRTRRSRSSLS